MILIDWKDFPVKEKLPVRCDECGFVFERTKKLVITGRKRWANDFCHACTARFGAAKRPQNSSTFWADDDRKAMHSQAMIDSPAYRAAILARDQSGYSNGMFGKNHTEETRRKMSVARTGKLGENATAWKGGSNSVVRRVKKCLQTRHRWFSRIFERDGSVCRRCGEKGKDAHHIEPIACIVRRLSADQQFETTDHQVEWLLEQPEIIDVGLLNGECLCRPCHRLAHPNWGSHVPVTISSG